jgi:hypothetical protein
MAKRCLRGKTPTLVLYTHGTDYSNSVATVRLTIPEPEPQHALHLILCKGLLLRSCGQLQNHYRYEN